MAGTDNNKPTENGSVDHEDLEVEQNEIVREEYDLLDTKLDELNEALDLLEQKNDDIHNRLLELLQSNRDIRKEMRHVNQEINNVN